MSPTPRKMLGNNKCSINICRVNELMSKLIHQLTIREMTFQVSSSSEILWVCGFLQISPSFLFLKFRIVGRYQSRLFCWHGHRSWISSLVQSWALFSKCSFFRLRNDYFHIWLASPVCQTWMLCQKAITSGFSQHVLTEGNHSHSPWALFY